MTAPTSDCPGCQADLVQVDGPTHRYIGASPACWGVYSNVLGGSPAVGHPLLIDAYAAQHPGVESAQSTQSVAVHLLTINAFRAGIPGSLVDLRTGFVAAGRVGSVAYQWLDPAPSSWQLTLHDVVAGADPEKWAFDVLDTWRAAHSATLDAWAEAVRGA